MAEGRSAMSGTRIALNLVGAMLGFLLVGAGGCHIDGIGGACSCPPPSNSATIELGCVPTEPPVVKTTGPCSVCPVVLPNGMIPPGSHCGVPPNSSYVILTANGAGPCHVELIFANGAASSLDVDFVSEQRPACCGDGENLLPVIADGSHTNPTVQDPTCDAGQDAAPSD
jgi:hypothetical protein